MKRFVASITHPLTILLGITIFFFWTTFVKGYIPFPGDYLLSQYNPWQHTSYAGYVAGSIPHKGQYFDVIRELYPWKTQVIAQLTAGQLPLWNPYNFAGTPLMANYQSQTWYPLGVLYFLLPQHIAWTALVILQVFLGLIATYLFARSIGLSKGASILGAVVFNTSSFASVWLEFNTVWHTVLWVPFLLYLFEKRLQNAIPYWHFLFVFGLVSALTAGHPQDFINSMLFIGTYVSARLFFLPHGNIKTKISILLEIGVLLGLSLLIGGIQLLPTIELYASSSRVPHDVHFVLNNMLIQIWQLPIAIITDFFGNPATRTYVLEDTYINKSLSIGTVGFFLAIVSLWTKKTYHTAFFIVATATLLILGTNNPVSQLFYQYPIPLLSTGTPTRNLFIYIFSVSMLAAFGFDALKRRNTLPKALLTITGVFIAIFAIYIVRPNTLHDFPIVTIAAMKKSFLLAGLITTITVSLIFISKRFFWARFLIIALAALELFWGFTKFNSFVPSTYIFPTHEVFTYLQKEGGINRFWGYGAAQIEANYATQYNVYSPDGTDPLNLKWYNSFIQSSGDGKIHREFTRSTRSDATIATGYGATDLPANNFRLRVLDMLGVKFILDRVENPQDNQTFSSDRFHLLWQQNGWTMYENLLAAPRYFLTNDVVYFETDKEFTDAFFAPTFNPATTILLPKKYQLPTLSPTAKKGDVQLLSYTPNAIQFEVKTDTPQVLFLSDTYDVGWKAFVNEKEIPLMQVNYAFRGVLVPEGTHTIEMKYMPTSVNKGAIASTVGLLLLGLFLLLKRRLPF